MDDCKLFIFGVCILGIEMIIGKAEGFLGGGGCGRIRSYILMNYVKFEMLVRHISENV